MVLEPPQVRKDGTVKWLRPDGKTQVTVEYKKEGGAVIPQRVHTILISTQHDEDVTNEQIHKDLMEHVIKPVSARRCGLWCYFLCGTRSPSYQNPARDLINTSSCALEPALLAMGPPQTVWCAGVHVTCVDECGSYCLLCS